jgi:hypothetical protein
MNLSSVGSPHRPQGGTRLLSNAGIGLACVAVMWACGTAPDDGADGLTGTDVAAPTDSTSDADAAVLTDGFALEDAKPDAQTDSAHDPDMDPDSGTDVGEPDVAADGSPDATAPNACADLLQQGGPGPSSLGCEFWPTVLATAVRPVFDFAVVVANPGAVAAQVTVTGPGGVASTAIVAPAAVATVYLPWVDSLKVFEPSSCTAPAGSVASVKALGGAYHLVSTEPVLVYQFNAIEPRSLGGPAGKDWAAACTPQPATECLNGGCYAQSNDASALMPSTSLTGRYRVGGWPGQSMGSYLAVTGTAPGTSVTVTLGSLGGVVAGPGVAATAAGGTLLLALGAGDVVELFANPGDDLSGAVVQADKPVQVMTGSPCTAAPDQAAFCDHVEESVPPAAALGRDYFVPVPTAPTGMPVGHMVRLYGDANGTTLSYAPAAPPGAPTTLNAGQVVDLGQVHVGFRVVGDKPFLVGTLLLSAAVVDPVSYNGDPSQSFPVATEQFTDSYTFFTPGDYASSFADVVAPSGAAVSLDGVPVVGAPTPVGATGFVLYRIPVGGGAHHRVSSTAPIGLQVMGYANASSYLYPGGGRLVPL